MINMPASLSSGSTSKESISPQVDSSKQQGFNKHLQAKKNQSKTPEISRQDEAFRDKEPKAESYVEQLGSGATNVKFGGPELEVTESEEGPTIAVFSIDQVGVGGQGLDASYNNTTENAQAEVLAAVIEESIKNADESRLSTTKVNLGDNLPIENVLLTKDLSGRWVVQLASSINSAMFSSAQLNQLKDRLKQTGCEVESVKVVSENDVLVEKIAGQGSLL